MRRQPTGPSTHSSDSKSSSSASASLPSPDLLLDPELQPWAAVVTSTDVGIQAHLHHVPRVAGPEQLVEKLKGCGSHPTNVRDASYPQLIVLPVVKSAQPTIESINEMTNTEVNATLDKRHHDSTARLLSMGRAMAYAS